MKATDLRISNLISDNGLIATVLAIDEMGCTTVNNGDYTTEVYKTYNEYKPLKLTEDWLLRFGFHKWGVDDMPSTVSFELAPLNIQYSKNTNCYGWFFEKREENNSLSWYPKVEIKYVHSLQNLFHALTGNELTITTPTP